MAWTEEQERLALRHNTMLRAWRDHGLPLMFGSRTMRPGRPPVPMGRWFDPGNGELELFLGCEVCNKTIGGFVSQPSAPGQSDLRLYNKRLAGMELGARMAREEQGCADWLRKVAGCTHLLPMLEEPPPEVWALFQLLILAAD